MKTQPVRKSGVVACWIFLLTSPLFARESTDVIVMKNGDHLTGEIKGLKGGVLYVSMKYILGTSSVEWSEVASLESKQLFIVKTENGYVHTGTLNTTKTQQDDRPMEIEIAGTSGEVVVAQPRIAEMDETATKFLKRFNGSVNTGIIYSKGNQSTQYNISSLVDYPRARWGAGASYNSTLSSSTGVTTSTRNQLTADVFRLLRWNNWFYEGLGSWLQSSEQGITNQNTVGGGVGRFLKNTNQAKITLLGGMVFQNTNYQQNIVAQNLTSGLIAANLQFFRFNKTNTNITATLLPVFNDPGRVKFNLNATYYFKLTGNLSWNASVYGNWDSQPPNGLAGSDYGSSSGLSWTFGNK